MAYIKPGCYNSDFTKFHHANIRKDITLTDLDAVQFRMMEDGSERIRLIEYKGTYEARRKMQMIVLGRFKNYMKYLNKSAKKTDENNLISFLNFNKEFQELEEKTG